MNTKLKTRQNRSSLQKRNRIRWVNGIEAIPSLVAKPEVLVSTQSVIRNPKRISVTAEGCVDGVIYGYKKKSLMTEFRKNKRFRDAIMSGAYFYYQGKICLYHPDVFVRSESGVKIADVVAKKPEDYLLSHYVRCVFVNTTVAPHKRVPYSGIHRTYRRGRRLPANKEIAYVVQVNHAKKYSRKEYREGKQFSEAFVHTVELVQGFIDGGLGSNPGETFGEFFSELMSERKITVKQLADKTDIPERTIIRMRTEDDYKPSIEYLIACCIVMQLPPWDSDTLFE